MTQFFATLINFAERAFEQDSSRLQINYVPWIVLLNLTHFTEQLDFILAQGLESSQLVTVDDN